MTLINEIADCALMSSMWER